MLENGTFFDCEVDASSHSYTESKPYSMTDAAARSQRIHELLHNIDVKRNKHLEVFYIAMVFFKYTDYLLENFQ